MPAVIAATDVVKSFGAGRATRRAARPSPNDFTTPVAAIAAAIYPP